MGRHSAPERTPFVRSLFTWALPWLLIAVVLGIALVVVFDTVGNDPIRTAAEGDDAGVAQTPESEENAAEDEPDPEEPEPAATQERDEPEREGSEPKSDGGNTQQDSDRPKLITKGINIQVLNGTADSEADDLAADRLARLGYTVVAVSPASRGYDRTVVFWTGDAQKIGRPLAERIGWGLEPAPSNLSSEVHLHVVVGEDAL